MLELLVVSTPFIAAGFGLGYFVRDCISWRRHREAARRHGHWYRSAREALVDRRGMLPATPARPASRQEAAAPGWPRPLGDRLELAR